MFPLFEQGLLAVQAAQNPGIGPQLDAMGIPVPGTQPQIGPWETTVNPAAAQGQGGNPFQALAGIKAPQMPAPIMSGGVTGGVSPPKVEQAGLKQGAPAIQALMQALLQRQQGQTVPSLGALVRGAV